MIIGDVAVYEAQILGPPACGTKVVTAVALAAAPRSLTARGGSPGPSLRGAPSDAGVTWVTGSAARLGARFSAGRARPAHWAGGMFWVPPGRDEPAPRAQDPGCSELLVCKCCHAVWCRRLVPWFPATERIRPADRL
jgi:hypothetical protein